MGRYQSAIYTFGILVPIHSLDDDDEDYDDCEENDSEEEGKEHKQEMSDMQKLRTAIKSFEQLEVVKVVADQYRDDSPKFALIYDGAFLIEGGGKGYP